MMTIRRTKWIELAVAMCLAGSGGLIGCSDDSSGKGDPINAADSGHSDAAGRDTAPPDTSSDDAYGADSAGEADGGACDVTGFSAPANMELDESATQWVLFGSRDDRYVELILSKDGGPTDVGAVQLDSGGVQLRLAEGCGQAECDRFYRATTGALDIAVWDKTQDGTFRANFSDVELAEVDSNFDIVADGRTWCLEQLEVSGSVDPMDTFAATCDRQGFSAADGHVSAVFADGLLDVTAGSSTSAPQDMMSLQIYSTFDGAATSAGTYSLDDFNFETCANCLLLYSGCNAEGLECDQTFSAGEGTLEIQRTGMVGDTFTATLTDARLAQVYIDGFDDTEIVDGGQGWCIDTFSWDLPITEPDH